MANQKSCGGNLKRTAMVHPELNQGVTVMDGQPIPLEAFGKKPGKVTLCPDGDLSRAIVEDFGEMVVGVETGMNPGFPQVLDVWVKI